MTTDRQIAANRQNAQHSTGPRTPEGKATASRNNTRHGLRATTPVIPGLESPEEWEHHRALTISGLNPVNALETALAERVALILWRLDRVARYEREVTSQAQDHAAIDLANGTDDVDDAYPANADHDLIAVRKRYNEARRRARVLAILDAGPSEAHVTGKDALSALKAIAEQIPRFDVNTFLVPEIVPNHLYYDKVPDWTVERLRRFITAIATAKERDPDELISDALEKAQHQRNAEQIACRRLTQQVRDLRQQRIIPRPRKLDHLVKYETHLMRQLSQTLGHLKQLQAARLRAPYNDYHQPIDDAPLPIPTEPDPPPSALPTLPQPPAPSTQHPRLERSNPIHSESAPAAASPCITPTPICTTIAPDCIRPDHGSLNTLGGESDPSPAL